MIEMIPWPQVLLGLAAALAVLIIYDVAYVWPLCRRLAAVNERCRALEFSLSAAAGLEQRLGAVEGRVRDDLGQLGERLAQLELSTEARSYEQAIGFAERGEQADRLISCFGLTEGEADLVTLLHGDRDPRRQEGRSA